MIQIPLFFLSFILRVIRVSVCAVSFHSNRITICLILSIDNKVGTNNIEFQRCPNVEISVQEIVYHSQLFYSILRVVRNMPSLSLSLFGFMRPVHDIQKRYLDSIFGKLVLSDYLHTLIAWRNIFSTVTLRWLTVFIIIPVNACVYA